MNGFLKQSTAGQVRWIGPFVDDTDFKTAETALTIANTDIKVSKNGGASASKNSGGGTHDVNGYYAVTWDATDTATVGELTFSVKVAGALQVFGSYTVLEEAIYDALFAASANAWTGAAGSTTLTALADNAITAAKIASDAITAAKIASDAITAAKIAADAITAAKIAADAFTAAKFAADVTAELQSGLATAAELAKVPKSDSNVTWNATAAAQIQSEATDALNAYDPPTRAELTSDIGGLDAKLDTIDNFLDTEMAAVLAAVDTEVAAILALLDDARTEPGQGAPPVNPDMATKIDYLYKWARNKKDNDGTQNRYYADDGTTVDHKQTVSESGGTVTVGEMATGA